jgi:hypothetical protein
MWGQSCAQNQMPPAVTKLAKSSAVAGTYQPQMDKSFFTYCLWFLVAVLLYFSVNRKRLSLSQRGKFVSVYNPKFVSVFVLFYSLPKESWLISSESYLRSSPHFSTEWVIVRCCHCLHAYCLMVGWLVKDELGKIWKQRFLSPIEMLSRNLLAGTEKKTLKWSQSW